MAAVPVVREKRPGTEFFFGLKDPTQELLPKLYYAVGVRLLIKFPPPSSLPLVLIDRKVSLTWAV